MLKGFPPERNYVFPDDTKARNGVGGAGDGWVGTDQTTSPGVESYRLMRGPGGGAENFSSGPTLDDAPAEAGKKTSTEIVSILGLTDASGGMAYVLHEELTSFAITQSQPGTPMSVSAVSSSSPFAPAVSPTDYRKARADFQALSDALQSNDLAGAQKDFTALQQDAPVFAQALSNAQSTSTAASAGDLKSLASALQSNDLTGAQSAMAALKQDTASTTGVGHHHRHHHYGAGNSATTPASSTTPVTSGSVINIQV